MQTIINILFLVSPIWSSCIYINILTRLFKVSVGDLVNILTYDIHQIHSYNSAIAGISVHYL